MKISRLELFKVPPRWLFLKISTDEGICGWGEPTLEGRADTAAAAVRELEPYLIGRDPMRIEDHFQTLHRGGFYRGGPVLMSAISGIEQALWDIKGKYYDAPVYDLLGGKCRDRIKVYAWAGGDVPAEVVAHAQRRMTQGFRAIKMNGTGACAYIGSHAEIDAAVARVAELRQAVGAQLDIAIDFHGRVHKGVAKALVRALEPFRPLFYEEPVLPEHNDALAALAHHTSVPLATGERMYSRWGFKDVIASGVVDIVQPDISHAGGLLECRKIAAMAEAHDIAVAPHCPLGPIAVAACLHLDACTPNSVIQELPLQIHYNESADLADYITNRELFAIADGFVAVPERPGLGVQVDEAKVRAAAAKDFQWRAPMWRLEDGSFAEW